MGLVPSYGGKCFDMTLKSSEAVARLATDGFDLDGVHHRLNLLGTPTIHVSVFVSVESPVEILLNTLATYGELKSQAVRRCHFKDEGLQHLENGARIVEFKRLTRDIPASKSLFKESLLDLNIPGSQTHASNADHYPSRTTRPPGKQRHGDQTG